MPANAAIYYDAEGFDTSGERLMGRHAAGEAFLRAFARHGKVSPLYCYAATRETCGDFERRVAAITGEGHAVEWIPHGALERLGEPGCLFTYDPLIAPLAWQRRHANQRRFSLCGITHTTATEGVMDGIGELMIAPFQPWDAIICTSQAVRDTLHHVLEQWGAYLVERMGGQPASPVDLPVIPLGVDCGLLEGGGAAPALRAAWRSRLNIGADDIVALFVGRLSFHAKANPLPMYLGLEQAAHATGKRVHLIQAGWFANQAIEQAFKDAGAAICPSVNVITVDGREAEVRRTIWFAADFFTSLSDNIQETFGLTPIEAMAAGLPVVVTDWNGYRDTVRNGETGFCVPTVSMPAGSGKDLAYRHAAGLDSYDRYLGHTSLGTGVDAGAVAAAYRTLIENPDKRAAMAASARQDMRARFDWSVVIAAYQTLWTEMAERRRNAQECVPPGSGAPAHPLRDDPFAAFAHYPSAVLDARATVALVPGAGAQWFSIARASPIVSFAPYLLLGEAETDELLAEIGAQQSVSVGTLLGRRPQATRLRTHRTIAWLIKLNVVRVLAAPRGGEAASKAPVTSLSITKY